MLDEAIDVGLIVVVEQDAVLERLVVTSPAFMVVQTRR